MVGIGPSNLGGNKKPPRPFFVFLIIIAVVLGFIFLLVKDVNV